MDAIKTVIIDDEASAIDMAARQLENSSFEVVLKASFTNPWDAVSYKGWKDTDLVIVDISMPSLDGFELLERLGTMRAKAIFCTAYDEHMLRALRTGAFDYLLKPLDLNDLNEALARFERQRGRSQAEEEGEHQRICIPTTHGYRLLELHGVVWLESSNSYTYIHRNESGGPLLVSKTLKSFERKLPPQEFVRLNKSTIVNINAIDQFDRRNGNSIVLKNGREFTLSPKYKEEVIRLVTKQLI